MVAEKLTMRNMLSAFLQNSLKTAAVVESKCVVIYLHLAHLELDSAARTAYGQSERQEW